MIKSIIATASALIAVTNPMPSMARGWDYCMNSGPTNICAIYEAQNDVVQMQGPAGYIRFGIKCIDQGRTYRWSYEVFEASTGNKYTKSIMKEFAEGYCEGRLGLNSQAQPKTQLA